MRSLSKKWLASPRTWSKFKAKRSKPNFIKITPSREWRSLMNVKPWFATYATKKATSPMSARWRMGEEQRRKERTRRKQASSPTPTPTRWTRRPPYLIFWRRRRMTRWWPSRWAKPITEPNGFGCQRKSFPTWKAPRRFGFQRGSEKSNGHRGIWRLGKVWVHFMGCIMMDMVIAKWVSENYGPKFPSPMLGN